MCQNLVTIDRATLEIICAEKKEKKNDSSKTEEHALISTADNAVNS